jgi:hypothetical protein
MSKTLNVSALTGGKKLADIPEDEMMAKFDDAIEQKMRATSRSMVDRRAGLRNGFRRRSAPPVVSIRELVASGALQAAAYSPPESSGDSALSSFESTLTSLESTAEDVPGSPPKLTMLSLGGAGGGRLEKSASLPISRLVEGAGLRGLNIADFDDESPRSGPGSLEEDGSPVIDPSRGTSLAQWMEQNVMKVEDDDI